ncbi:MAG: hypothetical protein HY253_05055 [Burkholderiales bacterium]|nr:hypothetical protein [Burkholderiales bacterium]
MKLSQASGKAYRHDKAAKSGQDRFAIYAAVIVFLILGIATYFIYQNRMAHRNAANLTYIELKQSIVNDQGAVARLAVTVQVNIGDEDWLKKNEATMNVLFRKELTVVDIDTLRNKEGIVEFQEELKRKINFQHKTDKVQSVMFTELLLQDQHENKLYK